MRTPSRQIIGILFTLILSPQLFAQIGLNTDTQSGKFGLDIMSAASKAINTAADSLSKISSQSGISQAVSSACVINNQIAKELGSVESFLFYFRFDSMTCIPLATALDTTTKTLEKCEKILTEGLQPSSAEILEDVSKALATSKQIFTHCELFPYP